jgi:glucose/mannose-6-phosphate isomerase
MTDLTREAIAALDPQGMLDDVLAQPHQIADALWRIESAGIERRDLAGGLVVAGMGGSAIGGDLALAAIGRRATAPVRTVRGYELAPWTGPDTLVLAASYSGDTEETIACFEAAGAAGMPRVALTTGGKLAELAREDGVPVIGVPSGMQPRAAVIYMALAAAECAALAGAAPSLRDEAEAAAELLGALAEEWGPDAPEDSQAKELARRLDGSMPVVFGAGPTAPVATRWKAQLNENTELPALAVVLPEADHNEVCTWQPGEDSPARRSAVFLEDPEHDPRVKRRIDLTAELIAPGATTVERPAARGESELEHVLSLVFLGDLVSVYLAVLRGVDPTPVEPLERFKEMLRAPAQP